VEDDPGNSIRAALIFDDDHKRVVNGDLKYLNQSEVTYKNSNCCKVYLCDAQPRIVDVEESRRSDLLSKYFVNAASLVFDQGCVNKVLVPTMGLDLTSSNCDFDPVLDVDD